MDKRQGFFSALHDGVARSFSPGKQRATSPTRCASTSPSPIPAAITSDAPVSPAEARDPDCEEISNSKRVGSGTGQWVLEHLTQNPLVTVHEAGFRNTQSDLRLLLGVMGAPLGPVCVSSAQPLPHLTIKDSPIDASSAQYILQQYIAATGGEKVQMSVKNAYARGKLKIVTTEFETESRVVKNQNVGRDAEHGGFVTWRMDPDMWHVEIAVGGTKIHAGCNGKLVWRHTPWLGTHTLKGPVRPLRRSLQGLDPRTTASMFLDSICIGEKNINGEDCFILKVSADPETMKARSEAPSEIIRHALFGYFSQKTGLLVYMEDSHLTRIQSHVGGGTVYWETTTSSYLDDYFPVGGILIAHSGRSRVTLFRFADISMSHMKTRMEEVWVIEEVLFNVPRLSADCFIPPAELRQADLPTRQDGIME